MCRNDKHRFRITEQPGYFTVDELCPAWGVWDICCHVQTRAEADQRITSYQRMEQDEDERYNVIGMTADEQF